MSTTMTPFDRIRKSLSDMRSHAPYGSLTHSRLKAALTALTEIESERNELRANRDFFANGSRGLSERNEYLERKCDELHAKLGNLLAVIHCDGGHYEVEHGLNKACEDAEKIVAERFAKLAECERQEPVAGAAWLNEYGGVALVQRGSEGEYDGRLYRHPVALREPTDEECQHVADILNPLAFTLEDIELGRAAVKAVREVMK